MFGFRNKVEEKTQCELQQLEDDKADLKSRVKDLTKEKRKLEEEVEKLKLKKKIEDEDIKHMVKIQTEQNEIELQKKIIEAERKASDEVATVKDEYRDKMEKQLTKETENIKTMYGQILERLPNINARLKVE